MYHDTIDMVLKAFDSIPQVVNSHDQLKKVKESLQSALQEPHQMASSENTRSDPQRLQ